MKKLEVRLTHSLDEEIVVGQLAERDRRVYFEFSESLLATGWELSPWKLPAKPELQEHKDLDFGRLPGLFDDSLPDGWGLLLMDRHFRRLGYDLATISPLDRLSYLGTRTMGALTYHPAAEADSDTSILDLNELSDSAQAVLSGSATEVLPELLRAGGSPGGARPKVLIGVKNEKIISGEDDLPEGYEHWIVKFAAESEGADAGRLELAYARMAIEAGITMPPTRLFETDKGGAYFGIRRFDRESGNKRLHSHTLGNLIHANFRIPSCDYDHLFRVTRALTRDHQALLECFRRMVFNIAAHNRDDHVKNFAFLMDHQGQWSLSPAYDLVFAEGPGGEHQMTINGEGRQPTRESCLKLAELHGISRKDGETILEEVNAGVFQWARLAREAGCRRKTIQDITKAHRAL